MIRQLKAETVKDLLFKKAPVAVLINIFEKSPTYVSQICKDTNVSFAHLNELVKIFEENGLVEKGKIKGRTRYVTITEKGKDIAASMMSIIDFKSNINATG